MKDKILASVKKQINKIKEIFDINKNSKENNSQKISLWRRFLNFIHSLFRSNRKVDKNDAVIETVEQKESDAVIEKVEPKESDALIEKVELKELKETVSVHTSTVSIASTAIVISVPVVLPEVPATPPSPSSSSSSSYFSFSSSSSSSFASLDLDLLEEVLTNENNKPLQVQVLPGPKQESDLLAPCSDTSNSKAEVSKQVMDAEIIKKIDDMCDSTAPIKGIEVIKTRPKGPARRKPTAALFQARKTEIAGADNNQDVTYASLP